jgi:acetyltransferase-like isoleucine patch superfamily enzyme
MILGILKNPISVWMYCFVKKICIEIRFRKQRVKIGYMVNIHKSKLGGYNQLYDGVRLWDSSLGSYSYISKNSQINRSTIGKFCAIGPNVQMGLGNHPTRGFVSIHPAFYSTLLRIPVTFSNQNLFQEYKPITIGNDVWIGANVVVADGVTIGDGAIVTAGAIVTKDVLPYEIVGGVPAKLIRKRFTEEQIVFLQKTKWWDQDKEWLKQNASRFSDIESFVEEK